MLGFSVWIVWKQDRGNIRQIKADQRHEGALSRTIKTRSGVCLCTRKHHNRVLYSLVIIATARNRSGRFDYVDCSKGFVPSPDKRRGEARDPESTNPKIPVGFHWKSYENNWSEVPGEAWLWEKSATPTPWHRRKQGLIAHCTRHATKLPGKAYRIYRIYRINRISPVYHLRFSSLKVFCWVCYLDHVGLGLGWASVPTQPTDLV